MILEQFGKEYNTTNQKYMGSTMVHLECSREKKPKMIGARINFHGSDGAQKYSSKI